MQNCIWILFCCLVCLPCASTIHSIFVHQYSVCFWHTLRLPYLRGFWIHPYSFWKYNFKILLWNNIFMLAVACWNNFFLWQFEMTSFFTQSERNLSQSEINFFRCSRWKISISAKYYPTNWTWPVNKVV